jgi:hypothetical protein
MAHLDTAIIESQSGKFLLDARHQQLGCAELDTRTPPDDRLSLIFAPGEDSYPLINYQYAVVSTGQIQSGGCRGAPGFPAVGERIGRRQHAEIS